MKHRGHMAIYFNAHFDAPRVWCIADIDRKWEIAVVSLTVKGGTLRSQYEPGVKRRADHSGPPSAWFEFEGELAVDVDGHAVLTGASDG